MVRKSVWQSSMYLRTKSGVIAGIVENFGNGVFTVSRKPLNGSADFVNLGRDLSDKQVQKISIWLCKRAAIPSWEVWKVFLRSL